MKINKNEFTKAKLHAAVTPGEAIKIIRESQGLSQNDLAELTDISESLITALENDTHQLNRECVIILANALHVHPAVLLFPDFEMDE